MNQAIKKCLLQVQNLGVNIGGCEVLSGIDLDIRVGEVVALVGPNGSGKTTLIKTLAGEQRLDQGEIFLHEKHLNNWPVRDLARSLAVLPQKSVLDFPFTAREVVGLARTPHDTGRKVDARIVSEVLDYLDAAYLADRLYPRLSGGEQQRIQLARVLAQIWGEQELPRLLILDEPSSYFDLAHQQMLVELVARLADRGIAVLMSLHDINMAMACADRIAVLCAGRLQAFGTAQEVITTEMLRSVFAVNTNFVSEPESGQRFMALSGSVRHLPLESDVE